MNSAIVLGKCETYLGYREQCGLNCVDEIFFNVKIDRKLLWNNMKKGLESRSNNFVLMSLILKLLPVIEH